jgi:predicted DNA-binding transcriptional regulator YafY
VYTDYSLRVAATRDFEQELLWHGRKIIVLSPDSLKQEMIGILKDMTESYETKRDTYEE